MRQLHRIVATAALLLAACSEDPPVPAPPDAEDGMVLEGDAYRIAETYRLPQQCEGDAIPRWNGSRWTCGTEPLGVLACAAGETVKWDGVHWACASDEAPTFAAGEGLVLEAGTFTLADSFRVPQDCAAGSIPRWDGSAWRCGTDSDSGTLTGVIPGAGLVGGGTEGVATVALDTAFTDARYAPRLGATTDVPATGDPAANGAALLAAVAAIPARSSPTPWLIRLEPGQYFLGTSALELPSFVNLVGAGANVTQLSNAGGALLVLAGSNQVRDLTVRMGAQNAAGIRTYGPDVLVRDVRVQGMQQGQALRIGIHALGSLTLEDVHVEIFNTTDLAFAVAGEEGRLVIRRGLFAAGNASHAIGVSTTAGLDMAGAEVRVGANGGASTAVEISSSPGEIRDSLLESAGETTGDGILVHGTSMLVERSRVSGTTSAFRSSSTSPGVVRAASTMVSGPIVGQANCVGSYGPSLAPLGTDCR